VIYFSNKKVQFKFKKSKNFMKAKKMETNIIIINDLIKIFNNLNNINNFYFKFFL
jgi:hypothetical protein